MFRIREVIFSIASPMASYPVFRHEVLLVPPLKLVETVSLRRPTETDVTQLRKQRKEH